MGAAKLRRQAMGAAYGAAPAWAWHYTLGRKIPLILRDGALRDAWMDCNRERFGLVIPYSIWLTTAESMDPTSTPALTLAQCYRFDRAEFKHKTGGHWRIGYRLPHPAITTYEEARALHPSGSAFGDFYQHLPKMGANRKCWRMACEPLPLVGCRIEELQGGQWVPHATENLPLDDNGPGYGVPGVLVAPNSYAKQGSR